MQPPHLIGKLQYYFFGFNTALTPWRQPHANIRPHRGSLAPSRLIFAFISVNTAVPQVCALRLMKDK